MKKMNKKGFTLIELLAVIIILGVLLLVAVPSVSRYIQNSRINTYETNLSKLVDAVSTEVNSYSNKQYTFTSKQYLVVPLSCIELERGSSSESPFGEYEDDRSFVLVDRKIDATTDDVMGFNYYVTAYDGSGFGAKLADPTLVEVKTDPTTSVISRTGGSGTEADPYVYAITNLPSDLNGEEAKVISCDAFEKDLD